MFVKVMGPELINSIFASYKSNRLLGKILLTTLDRYSDVDLEGDEMIKGIRESEWKKGVTIMKNQPKFFVVEVEGHKAPLTVCKYHGTSPIDRIQV